MKWLQRSEAFPFQDPEVLRLTAGDALQELSQRMENSSGEAQILVYSGHDTTVMPILKVCRASFTSLYIIS